MHYLPHVNQLLKTLQHILRLIETSHIFTHFGFDDAVEFDGAESAQTSFVYVTASKPCSDSMRARSWSVVCTILQITTSPWSGVWVARYRGGWIRLDGVHLFVDRLESNLHLE